MDSFFQSQGVGDVLIRYAIEEFGADNLWALEKNKRAIERNRSSDNDSGGKCLLDAGWFWSTGHKNHRNFERIAGWNI